MCRNRAVTVLQIRVKSTSVFPGDTSGDIEVYGAVCDNSEYLQCFPHETTTCCTPHNYPHTLAPLGGGKAGHAGHGSNLGRASRDK